MAEITKRNDFQETRLDYISRIWSDANNLLKQTRQIKLGFGIGENKQS